MYPKSRLMLYDPLCAHLTMLDPTFLDHLREVRKAAMLDPIVMEAVSEKIVSEMLAILGHDIVWIMHLVPHEVVDRTPRNTLANLFRSKIALTTRHIAQRYTTAAVSALGVKWVAPKPPVPSEIFVEIRIIMRTDLSELDTAFGALEQPEIFRSLVFFSRKLENQREMREPRLQTVATVTSWIENSAKPVDGAEEASQLVRCLVQMWHEDSHTWQTCVAVAGPVHFFIWRTLFTFYHSLQTFCHSLQTIQAPFQKDLEEDVYMIFWITKCGEVTTCVLGPDQKRNGSKYSHGPDHSWDVPVFGYLNEYYRKIFSEWLFFDLFWMFFPQNLLF